MPNQIHFLKDYHVTDFNFNAWGRYQLDFTDANYARAFRRKYKDFGLEGVEYGGKYVTVPQDCCPEDIASILQDSNHAVKKQTRVLVPSMVAAATATIGGVMVALHTGGVATPAIAALISGTLTGAAMATPIIGAVLLAVAAISLVVAIASAFKKPSQNPSQDPALEGHVAAAMFALAVMDNKCEYRRNQNDMFSWQPTPPSNTNVIEVFSRTLPSSGGRPVVQINFQNQLALDNYLTRIGDTFFSGSRLQQIRGWNFGLSPDSTAFFIQIPVSFLSEHNNAARMMLLSKLFAEEHAPAVHADEAHLGDGHTHSADFSGGHSDGYVPAPVVKFDERLHLFGIAVFGQYRLHNMDINSRMSLRQHVSQQTEHDVEEIFLRTDLSSGPVVQINFHTANDRDAYVNNLVAQGTDDANDWGKTENGASGGIRIPVTFLDAPGSVNYDFLAATQSYFGTASAPRADAVQLDAGHMHSARFVGDYEDVPAPRADAVRLDVVRSGQPVDFTGDNDPTSALWRALSPSNRGFFSGGAGHVSKAAEFGGRITASDGVTDQVYQAERQSSADSIEYYGAGGEFARGRTASGRFDDSVAKMGQSFFQPQHQVTAIGGGRFDCRLPIPRDQEGHVSDIDEFDVPVVLDEDGINNHLGSLPPLGFTYEIAAIPDSLSQEKHLTLIFRDINSAAFLKRKLDARPDQPHPAIKTEIPAQTIFGNAARIPAKSSLSFRLGDVNTQDKIESLVNFIKGELGIGHTPAPGHRF